MQASRADPAPSLLRLRLFGPFEISLDDNPLPRLRSRKSQWLLALLALRHGAEVERDWLAGVLWPEREDRQALRNSLSDLRRALGPEADRLRTPTVHRVSLDLSGAAVDVAAFDAAVTRGDPASLAEAVALYRGPLLEGCAEVWAFQERQPREQAYLGALETLAAHALAEGDPGAAEACLRRAAAVDPLRESTQRALMQALAASGNYTSALLCNRELRSRLHRELNAAPGAETQALFQQLRAEAREKAHGGTGRVRRSADQSSGRREARLPSPDAPRTLVGATTEPSDADWKAGAPAAGGENRLMTVLFADMSGSVAATQALDPEEAAALLNRLLAVMVDAVLRFGGRVDRFLGDGVLAIFGTPEAHEDDAERAVRAALEMREAAARLGYPVTIGINTGIVYAGAIGTERHRETTVVGPVVNLASRLQEQARPGQILLGEATYHLTRRAFKFSPHALATRGIAEPITAYSVTQALVRPEKARGLDGMRAPLIGREEELARLQAALRRILLQDTGGTEGREALRGQIVSLIGEAGVGKSRLLGELRAVTSDEWKVTSEGSLGVLPPTLTPDAPKRASAASSLVTRHSSPLWLEGRCLEIAATFGYALFADLLRHFFAWPAEADDAERVTRIEGTLRECAAAGGLSAQRAEEIGSLLAALFSLPWREGDAVPAGNTDPEQGRRQTFLAIRDLLLALTRRQPVVLVLEDLHWADSLSLDLISLLMETLAEAPLLLLCSYRPDPEHRCSRLGTVAAQKCPECYTELRLRELTPPQSRQLVASLLGTAEPPAAVKELVLDRSRGNPFFTEELVYSLVDGGVLYQESGDWRIREEGGKARLPESIQGVILSRIDRLDPALKNVLQHAAVIGRVFPRRLLEETVVGGQWLVVSPDTGDPAGRPPLSTALWDLEERGLIYQERVIPEEQYSFRHVLMQETIYAGILRSRRGELHRAAAVAIETLYAERLDGYYSQLGFHYERSGAGASTQERALDYLIRAAEQAHSTAAHREEGSLLLQAMAIAERLGRRDQVTELRARRGTALSRIGRWSEARAELETALAQLPADRTEARAEILIDLAGVCFWGVDAPCVRPYAAEGLSRATAVRRDDLAGTALAWLAVAEQMDGDLRASVEHYDQAMKKAGGFRTAPVMANAPLTRYLLGEYETALRLARQAVASIRGLNNTSATMYALSHLGLALAANGCYAEAMSVFEEARQFGIEYEVGHFVARATTMSAGFHLDVYDFAGHEARAEEAREMARQAGFAPSVVSAGIDLLLNFARCGEVGRAERLAREVGEQAAQVGGWHGWLWELRLTQARAEIALARGDAEAAQHGAEEAIRQSRRRERVKYQVSGLITRGQALASRKRSAEAIRDLQRAVELARPLGDPALFLRAAAALLALDGDADLATEARAAARRIAAALPNETMRGRFLTAEAVRLLGVAQVAPAA